MLAVWGDIRAIVADSRRSLPAAHGRERTRAAKMCRHLRVAREFLSASFLVAALALFFLAAAS